MPVEDFTPALEQVGAINRARTIVDDLTTGTFTDDTRPTGDEVQVLCELAAGQVADTLGADLPDEFHDRAQGAAAYYAAALVEGGAREPKDRLIAMWIKMADARVKAIEGEIREVGAGGGDGASDDSASAVATFPVHVPLPSSW